MHVARAGSTVHGGLKPAVAVVVMKFWAEAKHALRG